MTTKYCCDHDGKTMDFQDEKIVCLRVGAEITAKDFDTNKLADICPACWPECERLIKSEPRPNERGLDFDSILNGPSNLIKACEALRRKGYIIYKKG